MNRDEEIAMHLLTIWCGDNHPDEETLIEKYRYFINEVKGIRNSENDILKLRDEVETYEFIFKQVANLLKKDDNNFILKEDLDRIKSKFCEEYK